jgi:hypothetical protein
MHTPEEKMIDFALDFFATVRELSQWADSHGDQLLNLSM